MTGFPRLLFPLARQYPSIALTSFIGSRMDAEGCHRVEVTAARQCPHLSGRIRRFAVRTAF
jgi:hypothetical protein